MAGDGRETRKVWPALDHADGPDRQERQERAAALVFPAFYHEKRSVGACRSHPPPVWRMTGFRRRSARTRFIRRSAHRGLTRTVSGNFYKICSKCLNWHPRAVQGDGRSALQDRTRPGRIVQARGGAGPAAGGAAPAVRQSLTALGMPRERKTRAGATGQISRCTGILHGVGG